MKLEHFLLLIDAIGELKERKNLKFVADSNFLEKPSKVIDLKSKKLIKQYKFENGNWREVQGWQ